MNEEAIKYFEQMAIEKEAHKVAMEEGAGEIAITKEDELMLQDAAKLESERAKSFHRVRNAAGEFIQYHRSPSQLRQIQSIKFEIEDLKTMENMQQRQKVQRLQDLLNKYVIGDNAIPITGEYDNPTAEALRHYEKVASRWNGDPYGPDENPLATFEQYKATQRQKAQAVDIRKGFNQGE